MQGLGFRGKSFEGFWVGGFRVKDAFAVVEF